MRENAQPMADCLVKEIAKPAKDSVTEVIRSADLIDYTAEEGLRALGEGQMLTSDSFPGQKRNKLCMVSKVSSSRGSMGHAARVLAQAEKDNLTRDKQSRAAAVDRQLS
jgi:CO/xanthine dehydrogenase FAD-binding subunit